MPPVRAINRLNLRSDLMNHRLALVFLTLFAAFAAGRSVAELMALPS